MISFDTVFVHFWAELIKEISGVELKHKRLTDFRILWLFCGLLFPKKPANFALIRRCLNGDLVLVQGGPSWNIMHTK